MDKIYTLFSRIIVAAMIVFLGVNLMAGCFGIAYFIGPWAILVIIPCLLTGFIIPIIIAAIPGMLFVWQWPIDTTLVMVLPNVMFLLPPILLDTLVRFRACRS